MVGHLLGGGGAPPKGKSRQTGGGSWTWMAGYRIRNGEPACSQAFGKGGGGRKSNFRWPLPLSEGGGTEGEVIMRANILSQS